MDLSKNSEGARLLPWKVGDWDVPRFPHALSVGYESRPKDKTRENLQPRVPRSNH